MDTANWIAKMWGNAMTRTECDVLPVLAWKALVEYIRKGLEEREKPENIVAGWQETTTRYWRGRLDAEHFNRLRGLIAHALRGEEIPYVERHPSLDQQRSLDSILRERRPEYQKRVRLPKDRA